MVNTVKSACAIYRIERDVVTPGNERVCAVRIRIGKVIFETTTTTTTCHMERRIYIFSGIHTDLAIADTKERCTRSFQLMFNSRLGHCVFSCVRHCSDRFIISRRFVSSKQFIQHKFEVYSQSLVRLINEFNKQKKKKKTVYERKS